MKEQLKEGWKKTKQFVYRNRYEIGMGCALVAGGIVVYKILTKSPKTEELLTAVSKPNNEWEKSIFEKFGIDVVWPTDGGCVPETTREGAIKFIDKIGDGKSWIQLDVFDGGNGEIMGCIWLTPKDPDAIIEIAETII